MTSPHPTASSWRRFAIRPTTVAAICAAAAITAAGCGSGAAKVGSSGGQGTSASQALALAASAAQKVNSFAADMTISSSGTFSSHLSGTLAEQVKPTLLARETFSLKAAGITVPGGMQTLLTGNAVYLQMKTLQQVSGKPWVKLSFSSMKGKTGVSLAPLVHQLEGSNPLAQTQMLPAASGVHRVGTATINGVATTEYAGTLDVGKSLAKLDPSLRKLVGPALQQTGVTTSRFHVWVDAQHQVRKLAQTEVGSNTNISTVMTITAINQPVHVQAPPASQVASLPGM